MYKKVILCVIVFLFSLLSIFPQGIDNFSLSLNPAALIPIGDTSAHYTIGGSALLSGEYKLPFAPVLFLAGQLGYSISSNILTNTNLSLVSLGGGTGLSISPISKLNLKIFASGGYYLGIYGESFGHRYTRPANGL
ncbi:MAG: hypothetical protein J7K04_10155 [Spirochaetales bacterium]|nr:hypothetical protein [Spirochaetales bacterium]